MTNLFPVLSNFYAYIFDYQQEKKLNFCRMIYEIGARIRKKIEEKGINLVFFANEFGMTPRNLQHFFKKTDITLQQAALASKILNYDFLSEYLEHLKDVGKADGWALEEPGVKYKKVKRQVTTTINISADIDVYYENFADLLKEINKTAKALGFDLT